MVFINQNALIYVPSKKYLNTPEYYNLKYENYIVSTKDGEKINEVYKTNF